MSIPALTSCLEIIQLFGISMGRVFTRAWRWPEISSATVQIGIESLPVITLATVFSGILVSTEIAWHMDQALHTVEMIPGVTGQFILRELGIAIPALLLASKAGAATAAEVGSMRVTEQIDALELLGVDPIDYLVVPRMLSSIFSLVCLTLIAVTVTMAGAIFVAMLRYHFAWGEYVNALRPFVEAKDLVAAVVKASVFGAVIPVIACSFGLRCKGGAEGVGTATTDAVVASTIAIIFLDFILTSIFIGL